MDENVQQPLLRTEEVKNVDQDDCKQVTMNDLIAMETRILQAMETRLTQALLGVDSSSPIIPQAVIIVDSNGHINKILRSLKKHKGPLIIKLDIRPLPVLRHAKCE
jgi:hypothetical protein